MKVAIYGKSLPADALIPLNEFCTKLFERGIEVWMHERFFDLIEKRFDYSHKLKIFGSDQKPLTPADVLISFGGDGTLLDAALYVRDLGTPILGINTGRLGFLASIGPKEIELALKAVTRQPIQTQQRTVLEVVEPMVPHANFALNEVTILKKDTSSMLTIHVEVNGEYLCNYWADGLIISTPTGSTAYSLSCGGPIVLPGSNNLIITAIAPHNLTVRPIVIPDNAPIRISIEGRGNQYLLAMDSRSRPYPMGQEIVVQKADFAINLVEIPEASFFKTLRNKLMWGIDKRN